MRTLRLGSPADAGFDATWRLAAPGQRGAVGATPAGSAGSTAGPGPRPLRRPWGPGWALVGDAGYFKDPISTHGITDALRRRRAARRPRSWTSWAAGGPSAEAFGEYQPAPRPVSDACSRSPTRSSLLRLGRRHGAAAAARGERRDDRRGRAAGVAAGGTEPAATSPDVARASLRRPKSTMASRGTRMDVDIAMLGTFSVTVDARPGRGREPGRGAAPRRWSSCWPWPTAARLHREQVIEALWPTVPVDAAVPRLHKAAHYARRALGTGTAPTLVLRHDHVALLPDADVRVDVDEFRAGRSRRSTGLGRRGGEAGAGGVRRGLLPEDLYEPWAAEARETVVVLHLDLLRLAARWDDLRRGGPDRRGGAPGAGPRARWPRRRTRRAAPARAAGPCAAARARHVPSPEAERLRAELASVGGAGAARRRRRTGRSG